MFTHHPISRTLSANPAFILVFFLARLLVLPNSTHAQSNGVYREVYTGIGGVSVSDLTSSANYPNNPTSASVIADFFEAPIDVDDNYGQRIRALVTAPTSGSYSFWISSDDGSVLYLSTDANPSIKQQIASVAGWTSSREWTKEANQKSAPIVLVAGQRYYIEALMKEGQGGDNLAVRWQLPNGIIEEPIPASRLSPYGLIAPDIISQPANTTAAEGSSATFAVQVSNPSGMSYQWQRNGVNIAGATSSSHTILAVGLSDNGASFRCVLVNAQGNATTTTATLTVQSDTTAPSLVSVVNLGDNNIVTVLFSEPVDSASSTQPSNYTINNGIQVIGAKLQTDARTVILTTSTMAPGTTYTLTVNNVRDRASTPNTIAAASQKTFSLDFTPLDISDVVGTSEPLSHSSRRTGLIFSEIMYHPAPRVDGKNLEFVELYNAQGYFEDISGYRLTGAIEYTIPPSTTLAAGSFVVVAAVPADLQSVYGIGGVLGGFTNSLQNSSGAVRLRNRLGAVLLEAKYSAEPPFPAGADGAGHSLVLARPSYGEANPEAWAASELVGGSPGAPEATQANPFRTVVINEFLAHTDDPELDFIELYNYASQPVNVSGCFLTDDPSTNKFTIPAGTTIAAKGFLVFNQSQLGFALSAAGETIYFKNPPNNRVLDAIRFKGQANGVSTGRYPDGAGSFHELATKTPGTSNGKLLIRSIVINEIMYNPISGDDDDQYIELYNQGAAPANLGKWRLEGGIDFKFPVNTAIPGNGYLVVARDAAHLLTNYPALNIGNTLGNFNGKFSHNGDRLVLTMPDDVVSTNSQGVVVTNIIHIAVDEVNFGAGGRWGRWSDGGGSSLELIDPRSDHGLASNWADSDETAKSAWTTVEHTGVLDNGNSAADSFQIFLQGAGECLIDNVEVLVSGGANLISNPDFESGLSGWFPQGTHDDSFLETSGGYAGSSKSLHLRAAGRGDTGANRIRATLTSSPNSGQTATLRARVRWLTGNPEILLRLHGNWLEAPGNILTARNLGTPGARNSRAASNAGPAISKVRHSPVLPAANQPVVVKAQVSDPDGLSSLVLSYRVEPSTNFTIVSMVNNGAGLYSATIVGQPSGTMVAFSLTARDNFSPNAATTFPADAPVRECLIRFGEAQPAGTFATYRTWLTQATQNRWATREKNSNKPLDATFVYGIQRAIYNIGTLYSGSPWHTPGYNSPTGNMCDYVAIFPGDDLFLGTTDFVLASVGNLGSDDTAQREQAAFWMLGQLGLQNNYRRYVRLFVNGQQRGAIFEDAQQPSAGVVDEWFANDNHGDLHKIEDWFEFDSTGDNKLFNVDATLQNFTTTAGVKKLARYRWNWRKRAVSDSANAYTNLFALVDAVNNPNSAAYTAQTEAVMDVEAWMRVFCVEHIAGNWDSYGYGRGKNMYAYKPDSGKWQLLAWDIDFVLGSGSDGANTDMFANVNDPTITRMLNHPPFRRAYFRAMQDAVNGPLLSTTINPILDAKYAALVANGVSVNNPSAIKTFVQDRRNFIITNHLNTVTASFAITSNNGNSFSVNNNLVALTGTAPVGVKTIEVNGIAYPPTWTGVTSWTMNIPLSAAVNSLSLQGYDLRGNLISGASDTITVTYTGAAALPQDYLVINEIMYNPLVSDAAFIEIHNTSSSFTFDLSNYRLNGADFTFSEGTIIAPGGFVVVVKNPAVFAATYGSSLPIAGVFNGQLDNGGETLSLIKPGATSAQDVVIDEVRYDTQLPWPLAANGTGPSLQLIDPTLDNTRVGNWAAAVGTGGGTSPQWTFVSVTGTATSSSLYLYLNSAGDVYIDDLTLVAGSVANVGPNLIQNGSFDSNLTGWTVSANHSPTVVSSAVKHSGTGSLQLVATSGGTTRGSSVWQDIAPALTQGDTYSISYWYLPSANGSGLTIRLSGNGIVSTHPIAPPSGSTSAQYSPGAANSVHANLPAFPALWINEVQPNNANGTADHLGERDPWIELHNSGTTAISLSGYYLGDNYTNLTQWAFPANATINAGQFMVIWADGQPGQTIANELHANFRLDSSSSSVALVWSPNGPPQVLDYVSLGYVGPDRSYGSYPNGQSIHRQVFHYPTPAASNNPASAPVAVVINEWMASNTSTLADPVDGQYDDWFELYNSSLSTVDLSGYYLTDNLTNKTEWLIPSGTTIVPRSYLLVWADNQTSQNGINSDLHANFQLNKSGEAIGLFAPDGTLIDSVTFGTQTNDVSQGRFPDGQGAIYPLSSPTPRAANFIASSNNPPVLAFVANQTVNEGSPLAFTAAATDPDSGDVLTFSLDPGAPSGATINPSTGLFTWTPGEAQGPNNHAIIIRVTDSSSPGSSATRAFTVTVNEMNIGPTLAPMADQTVNEGDLVSFSAAATDSDIPANTLTFSLDAGAPAGATINPGNGVFTWTPSAAQAPGVYAITVRVTDDGLPALSDNRSFTVAVNSINQNTPPVLAPIASRFIIENASFTFTASATDLDQPPQTLIFSLEPGAPEGAIISPAGAFSWTPSESQGPGLYNLSVRVTDNGNPNLSATKPFGVRVGEDNTGPVLAAIPDQSVNEGSTLSFVAAASDADWPAQKLTFSLDPGAPSGATIDPDTGIFTWTPTEAQGPSTNSFTLRVTDNGSPALSGTKAFSVVVNEVNVAPVVEPISNQTVNVGSTLTFTAAATDADLPAQTLAFSLDPGSPPGASINSGTGVFSWSPTQSQSPATNTVTIRVTDTGSPALSGTNTVTVVVLASAVELKIAGIQQISNDVFRLSWNSQAGKAYRVEYKTLLKDANWSPNADVLATGITASTTNSPGNAVFQRFYRITTVD